MTPSSLSLFHGRSIKQDLVGVPVSFVASSSFILSARKSGRTRGVGRLSLGLVFFFSLSANSFSSNGMSDSLA